MKRLFPKIPASAKRVASGGMIRGMFRYDSGYDSPSLVYCLHKYTLASPAEQLPQLIFEGADWAMV